MKNSEAVEEEEENCGNQTNPELPQVIISDILSRLPLKTICRFRFMCKSWHNLLLNPCFAPTTLIVKDDKNRELYMIELHGIDSRDELKAVGPLKISPRFCKLASMMIPIASCNGLILLSNEVCRYTNYRVCNPLMGQYMNLPRPIKELDDDDSNVSFFFFVGFGFDPRTNQYKVMQVLTHFSRQGVPLLWSPTPTYEIQIHTLGTNMWRRIELFPKQLFSTSKGKYLNGALHWMWCNKDSVYISCFVLGMERYERIDGPSSLVKFDGSKVSFGVSRELLCVVDNSGSDLDVWVMKEYGVKESWTKEFVINPLNISERPCLKERVEILDYDAKSLILIIRCGSYYDRHLFAYNVGSKCAAEVHVSWIFRHSFSDQVLHVPSFVSLTDAVIDGEKFQIDKFGCVSKPDLGNVQIKQGRTYLDALLSNIGSDLHQSKRSKTTQPQA